MVLGQIIRYALMGGCLALSGVAGMHAFYGIAARGNPEAALNYGSQDSEAYRSRADQILIETSNDIDYAAIKPLAISAIKDSPLTHGVRQLGTVVQAEGKFKESFNLMALAYKITRRDALTHSWFVEYHARPERNNVKAALGHYNYILIVDDGRNFEQRMQLLTSAMEDPEIQAAFIPYIRSNPTWMGSALSYMASTSTEPSQIAQMLVKAGPLPETPEYKNIASTLLNSLVTKSGAKWAQYYYLSLKNADKSILETPAFTDKTINTDFAPITWTGIQSAEFGGTFANKGKGAPWTLEGSVSANEKGLIARRLFYPKPGTYRINVDATLQGGGEGKGVIIAVNCLTGINAPEVLRINTNDPEEVKKPLTIGSNCEGVYLNIMLAAGDAQDGMTAQIRSVRFDPVIKVV
jgi:hypothetical protein